MSPYETHADYFPIITRADKFYEADDDAALLSAFNSIGTSISNLHLTK
jgi:hypothetical protein